MLQTCRHLMLMYIHKRRTILHFWLLLYAWRSLKGASFVNTKHGQAFPYQSCACVGIYNSDWKKSGRPALSVRVPTALSKLQPVVAVAQYIIWKCRDKTERDKRLDRWFIYFCCYCFARLAQLFSCHCSDIPECSADQTIAGFWKKTMNPKWSSSPFLT